MISKKLMCYLVFNNERLDLKKKEYKPIYDWHHGHQITKKYSSKNLHI